MLTTVNREQGGEYPAQLTPRAAISELTALSSNLAEQFRIGAGGKKLTANDLDNLNNAIEGIAKRLLSLIELFKDNEQLDRQLIALQNAKAAASVARGGAEEGAEPEETIKFHASLINTLIADMAPGESYGQSEIRYRLQRKAQSNTRKAIKDRIIQAGILSLKDGSYTRSDRVMTFEATTTTAISEILKSIRYELVGSSISDSMIPITDLQGVKTAYAKALALTTTFRALLCELKKHPTPSEERFLNEIQPGEYISSPELILALARIHNIDKTAAKQGLTRLIQAGYFKNVIHCALPDALLRIDSSTAKVDRISSAEESAGNITIRTPHCERIAGIGVSPKTSISVDSLVKFITEGYHNLTSENFAIEYRPRTEHLFIAVTLLIIDRNQDRLKALFSKTPPTSLPNLKSFRSFPGRSLTSLHSAKKALIGALYDLINAETAVTLYTEAITLKRSLDKNWSPPEESSTAAKEALFELIGARNQRRVDASQISILQSHFSFNQEEISTLFLPKLRYNCKPAIIELLKKTCILELLARNRESDPLGVLERFVNDPENSPSWSDIAIISPIEKLLRMLPQVQKILSQKRPSHGGAN